MPGTLEGPSIIKNAKLASKSRALGTSRLLEVVPLIVHGVEKWAIALAVLTTVQ